MSYKIRAMDFLFLFFWSKKYNFIFYNLPISDCGPPFTERLGNLISAVLVPLPPSQDGIKGSRIPDVVPGSGGGAGGRR